MDIIDFDLLKAHAIKKPKEFLCSHPEYKLSLWQKLRLKYFLFLRQKDYSVAAITKHKEFYGLDFFVNKNVLIPRPETELMVAEAIEEIKKLGNKEIILIDVGTGSGCVPVAIIKSLNHKIIKSFATDISRSALRVAKKNARKHNANIKFLRGNLLEPILSVIPAASGNPDNSTGHWIPNQVGNDNRVVITANLPYLTEKQFQSEPSIQREPKNALVAKNNGLALYEELLQQIASFCHCEERSDEAISKNNGIAAPRKSGARNDMLVLLEIDPSQTQEISKLIKQYLPQSTVEIKKDLAGRDRLVKIIS